MFLFVFFCKCERANSVPLLHCVPCPRALPLSAIVPAQSWACEYNCWHLVVVFIWQRWHFSEPVSHLKESQNLTSSACSQGGAWDVLHTKSLRPKLFWMLHKSLLIIVWLTAWKHLNFHLSHVLMSIPIQMSWLIAKKCSTGCEKCSTWWNGLLRCFVWCYHVIKSNLPVKLYAYLFYFSEHKEEQIILQWKQKIVVIMAYVISSATRECCVLSRLE